MEKPKNLYVLPMDMNYGRRDPGWRGIKKKKWDDCNSIINKTYLTKQSYLECVNKNFFIVST